MEAIKTKIKDCVVFSHARYKDERGFFVELYNSASWGIMGGQEVHWRQINCSHSRPNVVRGLHIAPFAKLVTCVKGHVWDVVVDMQSLQWVGVDLTSELMNQIYVPPNCAHGFLALEESVVVYSQTGTYDPKVETSVNWRDPNIGVTWPVREEYIVSPKDQAAPFVQCGGTW